MNYILIQSSLWIRFSHPGTGLHLRAFSTIIFRCCPTRFTLHHKTQKLSSTHLWTRNQFKAICLHINTIKIALFISKSNNRISIFQDVISDRLNGAEIIKTSSSCCRRFIIRLIKKQNAKFMSLLMNCVHSNSFRCFGLDVAFMDDLVSTVRRFIMIVNPKSLLKKKKNLISKQIHFYFFFIQHMMMSS